MMMIMVGCMVIIAERLTTSFRSYLGGDRDDEDGWLYHC